MYSLTHRVDLQRRLLLDGFLVSCQNSRHLCAGMRCAVVAHAILPPHQLWRVLQELPPPWISYEDGRITMFYNTETQQHTRTSPAWPSSQVCVCVTSFSQYLIHIVACAHKHVVLRLSLFPHQKRVSYRDVFCVTLFSQYLTHIVAPCVSPALSQTGGLATLSLPKPKTCVSYRDILCVNSFQTFLATKMLAPKAKVWDNEGWNLWKSLIV